jgi:hypothetical protein
MLEFLRRYMQKSIVHNFGCLAGLGIILGSMGVGQATTYLDQGSFLSAVSSAPFVKQQYAQF